MSHNSSGIIEKMIADQSQKMNQQVKSNSQLTMQETASQTIISSIPPEGYCICFPGSFAFANDIQWTPSEPFSTAIYILCDGVDLDMKGFQLIAEGKFSTTSVGIKIGDGITSYKNVSVENGTICNVGYCGLSAVKTELLSLTKLTIEGLSYPTFDILPSGLFIDQATSFAMDHCEVKNTNVTALFFAGILLTNSTKGLVFKCTVDNVVNNDGVAAGYVYFGSSQIQSFGCNATNISTHYQGNPLSIIGHTCIGYMPSNCEYLTYTRCRAENMTGCCDDCHGMSLFSVNNVEVIGFYANQISDGNCEQKTGAKATGLEVYGKYITVKHSMVQHISAVVPQDLQATGFSACGSFIEFDNCIAEHVQVLDSDLKPNTAFGNGTGFGWAPDPRPKLNLPATSITYTNCKSHDCQVGFDTWNHQNSVWIDPITNECPVTILVEANGTERIFSMNFCSELPDSNPLSPPQSFPIINCAQDNTYLSSFEII